MNRHLVPRIIDSTISSASLKKRLWVLLVASAFSKKRFCQPITKFPNDLVSNSPHDENADKLKSIHKHQALIAKPSANSQSTSSNKQELQRRLFTVPEKNEMLGRKSPVKRSSMIISKLLNAVQKVIHNSSSGSVQNTKKLAATMANANTIANGSFQNSGKREQNEATLLQAGRPSGQSQRFVADRRLFQVQPQPFVAPRMSELIHSPKGALSLTDEQGHWHEHMQPMKSDNSNPVSQQLTLSQKTTSKKEHSNNYPNNQAISHHLFNNFRPFSQHTMRSDQWANSADPLPVDSNLRQLELQRRDNKFYWRCYFNTVTCF